MTAFPEWDNPVNRCDSCNEHMTIEESTGSVRVSQLRFHKACHAEWLKMGQAARVSLSGQIYAQRNKEKLEWQESLKSEATKPSTS